MLSPAANERRKWDASDEKAGLLTDNKNRAAAEVRALALTNDAEAPPAARGRVAAELLNIFQDERGADRKARPVPVAEKLLAEGKLPVAEEVLLRESLQRALADLKHSVQYADPGSEPPPPHY